MIEILFVLAVALSTGYQAGKAAVKAEARSNEGYCMMEMDSTEGCYQVKKVSDPVVAQQIKEKSE